MQVGHVESGVGDLPQVASLVPVSKLVTEVGGSVQRLVHVAHEMNQEASGAGLTRK